MPTNAKPSPGRPAPAVKQMAHDVWLVDFGPRHQPVFVADLAGARQTVRGPYRPEIESAALAAVERVLNPSPNPQPQGVSMCKPISCRPIDAEREREIREMRLAAKRPGVAQFAQMVAEARQLAYRINQWIADNPLHVESETILALKRSLTFGDSMENDMPDAVRAFSSIGHVMEVSSDLITGVMVSRVFPECFEPLRGNEDRPDTDQDEPGLRPKRKAVTNRMRALVN